MVRDIRLSILRKIADYFSTITSNLPKKYDDYEQQP